MYILYQISEAYDNIYKTGIIQNVLLSLQGLSVTEVTEGYEMACKKALETLPSKYDILQ